MIKLAHDEKIVRIIIRHWFVLLVRLIKLLFILVLPFVLFWFLIQKVDTFGEIVPMHLMSPSFLTFLGTTWVLIIWMQFFSIWSDHYLDGWIVTNKRIVDIEQRGFFSRQISNFRIERIQDVTTDVHGIIATLLDYGNIHVQTAGENQELLIKDAPHPKEMKNLILKEADEAMDRGYPNVNGSNA